MTTSADTSPALTREDATRWEGALFGRYRVLTHLANGGMASVHIARAEGTHGFERLVALKIMHGHLASEPEFVMMIADEARMAATVRNPHVVATLDIDEDPRCGLYLVMEYVEGDHLGNVLRALRERGRRLPPPVAIRIVLDLLEGLGAAHGIVASDGRPAPIVHRDVSPHNVLLGVDGLSRLADFGIARAEDRLTQTQQGRFKGKLAYMAPEQVSEGQAHEQSDLFSAAIVLWECLTGERLFAADTPAEVLRKLLTDPVPPPSSVSDELAPFDDFLGRCLSREASWRPRSAHTMAKELLVLAVHTCGVASPREVADIVRDVRHDLLADRSARLRTAVLRYPPEAVGSGEGRAELSGVSTRTSIPSKRRGSTAAASIAPERPGGRRLVAAAAFGAAAVAGGSLAVLRPSTESEVAVRPPAPTAPIQDRSATVRAVVRPVVSGDVHPIAPTVMLRVQVGANGQVEAARVIQPSPDRAALEQDAVEVARGYTFEPAIRGGRPVASEVELPLRFDLASGGDHVVHVKGSDTINAALTPALARGFRRVRPDVHVIVEALGSTTAFTGLFDGSADLGASSRAPTAAEIAETRRLGVVLTEHILGYDGIAVIVARDNPLRSVSLTTLGELFAGRLDSLAMLGGPDGPARLYGRPSYSGTHSYFAARVLEPMGATFDRDVVSIEHSDALVQAVAHDVHALGYVGATHLAAGVRPLAVADAGGAPVELTDASILDGRYPLARSMRVYVSGTPTSATRAFLTFMGTPEGRAIVRETGFVPAAPETAGAGEDGSSGAQGGSAGQGFQRRIEFSDGTTLRGAEDALAAACAFATDHARSRVYVVGHADAEGTERDNEAIGLARARAVADSMTRCGVDPSRLVVESRGSRAPVATNEDVEGRRRNRRVDLVIAAH